MNQILEVIITKKKINYIATCPTFPNSKGVGKSRKEALKKLADSISHGISKMIKSSLSNILTSENYTQMLFDHSTDDHNEQIAFSLNMNKINVPRSFLLKVASFSDESNYDQNELNDDAYEDDGYDSIENEMIKSFTDDDHDNQISLNPQGSQDSDSFVFGFPLNFN